MGGQGGGRFFWRSGFLRLVGLRFQVDRQSSRALPSLIWHLAEYVCHRVLGDRVRLLLRPVGGVRGLRVVVVLDLRRGLRRDPAMLLEQGHETRDRVLLGGAGYLFFAPVLHSAVLFT